MPHRFSWSNLTSKRVSKDAQNLYNAETKKNQDAFEGLARGGGSSVKSIKLTAVRSVLGLLVRVGSDACVVD